MMKRIFNDRYVFWAVLALPMLPMLLGLASGAVTGRSLLHPSGEFAARFMILALMVTPLARIFGQVRWIRWLQVNRRGLGVAAFAYALLHALLYLADRQFPAVWWREAADAGIWVGWLAMLVMSVLAAISNDRSQRWLGRRWKTIQRGAYGAALLTLGHWVIVQQGLGGALAHFAPLAALQVYRAWHDWGGSRRHQREALR